MKKKRAFWLLAPLCGALLLGTVTLAATEAERAGEEDQVIVLSQSLYSGSAWLGVHISDVTPEKVSELKLPGEYGVVVEEVEEESPAAAAGLQKNDVILEFAGERVRSVAHLRRLVRETPPGRSVTLRVSRGGSTRTVEAKLESRQVHFRIPEIRIPEVKIPPIEVPDYDLHVFSHRPRLGISGEELTPQLAEFFGVKEGQGVLVREVLVGSAAAKAGLQAGDVIVRVDDETVADVGDLRRALRRDHKGKEVTLTIVRDHREQTLKVKLEEPQTRGPRRIAEASGFEAPRCWWHHLEAELDAAMREATRSVREAEGEIRKALESSAWREEMQQLEQELKRLEHQVREEVRTI